jgi:NADH-quinone oxidoreductase subunit H
MAKVFGLVLLIMVVRWTLPRFRYDQLMRLAWEGMIPTALLVLLVTSLWVFLGLADEGRMWIGSLAVIVIIWLVRPLLARRVPPNARIPLAGSRFSPLPEEETTSR